MISPTLAGFTWVAWKWITAHPLELTACIAVIALGIFYIFIDDGQR